MFFSFENILNLSLNYKIYEVLVQLELKLDNLN